MPSLSPSSHLRTRSPSWRSSSRFAPETSSSTTISPSSASWSAAHCSIFSRWTVGEMYESPSRPFVLLTRMYPSSLFAVLDMVAPFDEHTPGHHLDGYRVELIER